jgi:Domain of unknown function (DUF3127)
MEIKGILKAKFDTVQISDKFAKREFIVTDNSTQYPQHISFQLTQDRCDMLNVIPVGAGITVLFNLRGREWVSPQGELKYFNTLEAWSIKTNAGELQQPMPQQASQNISNDNLPF